MVILSRSIVLGVFVIGTLTAVPAAAAVGHPGDPLSDAPSLRSGHGSFGLAATTVDHDADGTPSTCGSAEGAAVFALDGPDRAFLELAATTTSGTVCAIEIFAAVVDGAPLASVYDESTRAPFLRRTLACGSGTCSTTVTVPAGGGYLVVWPDGDATATASVELEGRYRLVPLFYGRIPGATAAPCFPARTRGLRFEAFVMPPSVTGDVAWTRTYLSTGATAHAVIPGGTRRGTDLSGWARGKHEIALTHPGNETVAPGTATRCVAVAGTVPVTISWVGQRYSYDDYAVWRDGDTAIIRATLPRGPSRGTVRWRLERNDGEHSYVPWRTFEVPITDGVAELRLAATYRPRGLPFYRIRPEIPGSTYVLPTVGRWKCIQFDPPA